MTTINTTLMHIFLTNECSFNTSQMIHIMHIMCTVTLNTIPKKFELCAIGSELRAGVEHAGRKFNQSVLLLHRRLCSNVQIGHCWQGKRCYFSIRISNLRSNKNFLSCRAPARARQFSHKTHTHTTHTHGVTHTHTQLPVCLCLCLPLTLASLSLSPLTHASHQQHTPHTHAHSVQRSHGVQQYHRPDQGRQERQLEVYRFGEA